MKNKIRRQLEHALQKLLHFFHHAQKKRSKKYLAAALLIALAAGITQLSPLFLSEKTSGPKEFPATHENDPDVRPVVTPNMPFIENNGQTDPLVLFYSVMKTGTFFVDKKNVLTYNFPSAKGKSLAVKENVVTDRKFTPSGQNASQTNINIFLGNESEKWQKNVSSFNEIAFGEIYEGIKLSLRKDTAQIEKIFTVAPGADPAQIQLRFEGTDGLAVNGKKELVLKNEYGNITLTAPIAYQETTVGKKNVEVAYNLTGKSTYGFNIGTYDKTKPLIIDPILTATFLGGSGGSSGNEMGSKMLKNTLDSDFVIVGQTPSTNFPVTAGAYDQSYNGGTADAFIAKMSSDLTTLRAATFYGGSLWDMGGGGDMVITNGGTIFISGSTESTNLPLGTNPYDSTSFAVGNNWTAFIASFSNDLSTLNRATYLDNVDVPRLQLNASGQLIACGTADYWNTRGLQFPPQNSRPGYDPTFTGGGDAYCAIFDPSLDNQPHGSQPNSLQYVTFIGGSGNTETVYGTTMDSNGYLWVTGATNSADFVTANNPLYATQRASYIIKFDGSNLSNGAGSPPYSTYFGATTGYDGLMLYFNPNQPSNLYALGATNATDYPTTAGAYMPSIGGDYDMVITKFTIEAGGYLTNTASTYLGGFGFDYGSDIKVLSDNSVIITGNTYSFNFPQVCPVVNGFQSLSEGTITKMSSDLSTVIRSTFLGGNSSDTTAGLYIDGSDNMYVLGNSQSSDFPVVSLPGLPPTWGYDSTNSPQDAFILKLDSLDNGGPDPDADNFPNYCDNCPDVFNPAQTDSDFDGYGDPCDPTVTDINPTQGSTAGGTNVTITGTNFDTTGTTTVYFDTTQATNVVVVDANTITATTPAHPNGRVNVTVSNPNGAQGTLNQGYLYPLSSPTNTAPTFCGFQEATGGDYSSLALKNDGTVWAWGMNNHGQLGNGTTNDSNVPIQVTDPNDPSGFLTGVTAVTEEGDHALALKSDGTVWAWGNNSNGQLGDGTINDSYVPIQVTDPNDPSGFLTGISAVANGRFHSMALKTDGTVWTWGYNQYGQLGDGTLTESHVPVQVIHPLDVTGFLTNVFSISAGRQQSYALKSDGTLWAWGYNSNRELGDGTTVRRTSPVQSGFWGEGSLSGITNVAAGRLHALALVNDGSSWAWGTNWEGEIGQGTTNASLNLSLITDPGDPSGYLTNVTSVKGGRFHSMALKNDGSVWTWGANWNGWLGDGTNNNSYVPVQVVDPGDPSGFLSNITSIGAGNQHSLAIKNEDIWNWGLNGNGQLGNGTNTDSNIPVQPTYTLNCISPSSGPSTGGTDITITGTNYQAGATVSIGGNLATNVTVVNSTTITARTPAHATGAVDVTVTNPDAQSATRTNAYTYNFVADGDGDGIPDATDNCPTVSNPGQENTDAINLANLTSGPSYNSEPFFSPDGTKIAFESDRDGNSEIYIMNADGSGQTRLTNDPGTDHNAKFSPDNTKIVFESDRDGNSEIYIMDADGNNQINLSNNTDNDVNPHFSPDGNKIYFDRLTGTNSEIFSMNTDGSNQTNLTNSPGDDYDQFVSPDGSKIYFDRLTGTNSEIFSMNTDGSNQTNLTNSPGDDYLPVVSPDGTKIYFESTRDGNQEIYSMNANGGNQTNLTNNAAIDRNPHLSPDGTKLAFESNRDGNFEVYIMNSNGTDQTNLSNDPSADFLSSNAQGVFSPDSATLAFVSDRNGVNTEIYTVNSNGDNLGNACDCQTDFLCTAAAYCTDNGTPDADCATCPRLPTDQTCAVTRITGGDLTFSNIPDNTAFTNAQNNTNLPSYNNASGTDAQDILSVTDLRDDPLSGFEVQLSASPFATPDNLNFIPLQYLYVASSLPRVPGSTDDETEGIEYAAGCSGATNNITSSVNVPEPRGAGDLGILSTFTNYGSTLGNNNVTVPVVLMSSPDSARRCTMSEAISLAVDLPAYISVLGTNIPPGTYSTTLTYTLISTSGGGGPTAPSAITDLNATPGDGQVSLNWTAPNNGGSAITDYQIIYGDNAPCTPPATFTSTPAGCSVLDTGSTLTTATVSGLTNGTTYIFAVYAQNAIGTATVSNTPTATPAPPQSDLQMGIISSNLISSTPLSNPMADNGLDISGNYIFFSEPLSNNFLIYYFSSPDSPGLESTTTTPYTPGAVRVRGNYAYITGINGSNQLMIYDVTSKTNPVFKGNTAVGTDPVAVELLDNGANLYAYVANSTSATISVVDVTDPVNPTLVTTYDATPLMTAGNTNPKIGGIAVGHHTGTNAGDYGYFTFTSTPGQSQLYILNINNPSNPTLVTTWTYNLAEETGYDVKLSSDTNTLHVGNISSNSPGNICEGFDVSDPTTPPLNPIYTCGGLVGGENDTQRSGVGDNGSVFRGFTAMSVGGDIPYLYTPSSYVNYAGDTPMAGLRPSNAMRSSGDYLFFSDDANFQILTSSVLGQSLVSVNHDIIYSLKGFNAGPNPANNVIIDQTSLPPGTSYVSATIPPSQQTCNLPCNLGTIGVLQFFQLNVRLHVTPAAADPFTETFTITSDSPDPNLANNTASITSDLLWPP